MANGSSKRHKAPKKFYVPKNVMSIHGWNSDRDWQHSLSNILSSLGYVSIPYRYGRKIFRIFKWQLNKDVEKFRKWYSLEINNKNYNISIDKPFYRPSIVAHSLGTWILAKALLKDPDIKFDKIILVGSIIPPDYDWFKLILNDQVNKVIYERTNKDKVVRLSRFITGSWKTCTRHGFIQKSTFIEEKLCEHFGHGDFSYDEHLRGLIKKHMPEVPHQLCAVYGRALDEKTIRQYFLETVRIDKEVYNDAVYLETPITLENGVSWFSAEPDIYTFVKNAYEGSILGYINAIPVDDDTYEKFISGDLKEHQITEEHVLNYDTCKEYNLLILSVAIKRSGFDANHPFQKKITEILMMAFLNKHLNLESKLKKFAAIAWNKPGKNLCEGFSMSTKKKDENGHGIYEFDIEKLDELRKENGAKRNPNFMARWLYDNIKAR